jgi:hypothetical protein
VLCPVDDLNGLVNDMLDLTPESADQPRAQCAGRNVGGGNATRRAPPAASSSLKSKRAAVAHCDAEKIGRVRHPPSTRSRRRDKGGVSQDAHRPATSQVEMGVTDNGPLPQDKLEIFDASSRLPADTAKDSIASTSFASYRSHRRCRGAEHLGKGSTFL